MFKTKFLSLFLLWIVSINVSIKAESQVYDEVVSLGFGCQIAWQLDSLGIRNSAYPFDWVHTSHEALIAFIAHKGANFFAWDKIAVIGAYPGDPARLQVVDLLYGIVSYHDFLSNPPMANYQDIKSKYDRRITRFFNLLGSKKKVLLIRLGSTRAEIEYLDYVLRTLYPNLSYTLVALHDTQEYLYNWGYKHIKNLYLPQVLGDWHGDSTRWKEIMNQFSLNPSLQPFE